MNLYDETDCLPHVKPDGGPAFPRTVQSWNGHLTPHDGMSLRDWFAGQALSGVASDPRGTVQVAKAAGVEGRALEYASAVAYELADAMIAARAASVLREAGE